MDVGDFAASRARQKRAVIILSTVLITGGIVILFLLKRVPLPARIMAGLGDVVAGCVLLLAWRQKFGTK